MGKYEAKDKRCAMRSPLVSIIIATYNYGHFILDALESVAAQRFLNWECIIVDDGSTDDTEVVVTHYISRIADQRFLYIFTENGGPSQARNIGILRSKGKYLQFLDADDLLSRDKLTVQVDLLNSKPCALVYSRSLFFEADHTEKVYKSKYPADFLAAETLVGLALIRRLIRNNIFTISSVLVHKDLVEAAGKFNIESDHNEDWLLWFKIALLKPIFIFDHSALSATEIRIHQSSSMSNKKRMYLGEKFVRLEMSIALLEQHPQNEINSLIISNEDLLALHQIRSLSLFDGLTYVSKRFLRGPISSLPLLVRSCNKMLARILKSN